jgi:hypothetical protein
VDNVAVVPKMHLNNLLSDVDASPIELKLDTTTNAGLLTPPQSREASSVDLKVDIIATAIEISSEHAQDNKIHSAMNYSQDMITAENEPTPPQTRAHSPVRNPQNRPHAEFVRKSWDALQALMDGRDVVLDGRSLDISSVVAVAKYVKSVLEIWNPLTYLRYNTHVHLSKDEKVVARINESVEVLARHLSEGEMVYG